MLTARGLTKKYGGFSAVKGIDLSIREGQLVAFLGPNGSGKSTTIAMLTGLEQPSSGAIHFEGEMVSAKDYYRKIGVVFQNSILDNELTVWENLSLRAKMNKSESGRLQEIMEIFQLNEVCSQKYETLSGGQKRRVDIARALLHRPKLLFLDEPTTGIDIQSRKLLWLLLLRLVKEEGLTIFLTTHYLEEAENADYIYILKHGKIVTEGTTSQLKEQHTKTSLEIESDQAKMILSHQPKYPCQQLTVNRIVFTNIETKDALSILATHKDRITSFNFHEGSLDDVFLAITEGGN